MNKEELQLLIECCSVPGCFMEMNLNESSDRKSGLTRFKGKFQEAEAVNKNKRSYPFSVLDENVKKLQEALQQRGLVGELDHPTDSIIHFEKASHVVTKLWWEGNSLMGEGEILPTPAGEILNALIKSGVRVGISSRGVGSGKVDENGILVISDSYKLITFDAVADPSTFNAFQAKVGGKSETYIPTQNTRSAAKNEGSGIHKVNKDALIACLGGIITKETSTIKARLG
jgi:prohead core protein serine protease